MNEYVALGLSYSVLESMTSAELNVRLAEIAFHTGSKDLNYRFNEERRNILRILKDRGLR